MRNILAIPIILILCFASFGVSLAFTGPTSSDKASEIAENTYHSSRYYWKCPHDEGEDTYEFLEMEVPQSAFESSMEQNIFRSPTVFDNSAIHFVRPDDKYVQTVVEHIESKTEGESIHTRATAALWFVQSTISYKDDQNLYGTSEFWAFPVETLFLRHGDCEDTTILLCSIYQAMGIDCALLDYSNHEAVGVDLGDGHYHFCETTSSSPQEIGSTNLHYWSEDPVIYPVGKTPDYFGSLNSLVSGYRNLFQRILTV